MEAIHVTVDARQITVYQEDCAQQAAGGGEGLRCAIVSSRTDPGDKPGKVLEFPGCVAGGNWDPEEDPEGEETSAGTRKTPGRLFQILDLLATAAVLGTAIVIALVFVFS